MVTLLLLLLLLRPSQIYMVNARTVRRQRRCGIETITRRRTSYTPHQFGPLGRPLVYVQFWGFWTYTTLLDVGEAGVVYSMCVSDKGPRSSTKNA